MNIHKVVVKVIILAAFWGQSVVATLNVATNGNDFTGDGSLAKPFASIQMAISSATNGSTILVQAGTYTGVSNRNLAVSGKNIDIVSESGPLNTIIDCGGVARAIVFSGAITNCLFSGFTIQNGYFNESGNWGQGGIVRVDNAAAPTIDRCIIRSNTVVNSYYTSQVGLVTINSTASVVLRNCLIIKNSVSGGVYSGGGYGTLVQSGGVQTNYIYNCTLADNTIAGNLRYSTAFFRGIVANVIDWNNSGAQSYSASNGATRYLNTLSQTIAANGIVSNNPQFFNVGVNDYTLFANSPCINSGTNMSWMTEAVDLANNARIISGFVDMGAYESGVRVSIPAQTLPAGTEMAFYSTTLQATNGMPPYLWSTTSSLPAGLLCGSNGIVSGVPTLAGTNDVDFAVQDNIGAISNRSLRIVISQNPNARPLINSNAPSGTFSMYETTNQLFQLWASDPESSNLTYTWFLDGAPVGSNASSYIYAPVWGDAGTHILRCYVSDDLWTNVVYMQWNVTVLARWVTLRGNITYSGIQSGLVQIVSMSIMETNVVALAVPGAYVLSNHFVNVLATCWGYRDSNNNSTQDYWEAFGCYTNTPLALTNDLVGINFTLADPDHDGDGKPDYIELSNGTDPFNPTSRWINVSGNILYSGGQTGLLRLVSMSTLETNGAVMASPGSYMLTNRIANVPVTFWAYRDSNNNATQDYWEACGVFTNNPVTPTNDLSGVNITLTDPDHDRDGQPDYIEIKNGTNPFEPSYVVIPSNGPFAGGNVVLVTNVAANIGNGTDIINATIGGVTAIVVAQGTNWAKVMMPATGSTGTKDISFQSSSLGATTLHGAYRVNPAGQIYSCTPSVGLYSGGYQVVIQGTNLCTGSDVTNVAICDSNVLVIISKNSSQVVVMASANTPRMGDVTVYSTSFGATVLSNGFAYYAGDEHFVSLAGSNQPPYTNWATASTNIQGALAVARNGDAVIVGVGMYGGIGNSDLTFGGKNICLRSQAGALETIIDCNRSRFLTLDGWLTTNTVIDGFTVTNAFVSYGGDWGHDGVLQIRNSAPILKNMIFRRNEVRASYCTATLSLVDLDNVSTVSVYNCVFADNKIGGGGVLQGFGGGGGSLIALNGGVGFVFNSTFSSNVFYYSDATWNPMFTQGGLRVVDVQEMWNCIVYANSATYPVVQTNASGKVRFSCVQGGVLSGGGNIDADPLFVSAQTGDYRLSSYSPCLDKGTNLAWMTSALDLFLGPRIRGSHVDMGAIESSYYETDGDGMPDAWEVANGFNPLDPSDASSDADRDGLTNLQEYQNHTNPRMADSDGDGMPDGWEVVNGFDPLDPSDAARDADFDGLTNLQEYQNHTNPRVADTDVDGMPDGWEVANGFNPLNPSDAAGDADCDGLTNLQEYQKGTNPRVADTDGDGLSDGYEVNTLHSNPTLIDTDGDGISDQREIELGTNPLDARSPIQVDADAINDPGPGDPQVSDPLADGSNEHPYDSIQKAINVATNGQVVLVLDGTYSGVGNYDISVGAKKVKIISSNGPDDTVIDTLGAGRGFWMHSGETTNAVISGFTIHTWKDFADFAGIVIDGAKPRIENCKVFDCGDFGIKCLNGANPTLLGLTVDSCKGGILCSNASPVIERCYVVSNTVAHGGGISAEGGAVPVIINTVIAHNTATDRGGGLFVGAGSCITSINCTVVNNSASVSGGGLQTEGISYIRNMILWTNTAPSNPGIYRPSGTVNISYSDVQQSWPGTTNINPLFRSGSDYALSSVSPCIDAGTSVGAPTNDFRGASRPADGDNNGSALFDMGAYEYQFPALSVSPASIRATVPAGFTGLTSLPMQVWNHGDGTLAYCVNSDVSWAATTPISGSSSGEVDVITLSLNADRLGAGDHYGNLIFISTGALSTTSTVTIVYTVLGDKDGDGMSDWQEIDLGRNPNDPNDAGLPSSLFGAVRGNGVGLVGASVELCGLSGRIYYQTLTDSSGVYTVSGVIPGTYYVNAGAARFADEWYSQAAHRTNAIAYAVPANTSIGGFDFNLVAGQNPALVEVTSEPSGATVYLDYQPTLQVTPTVLNVGEVGDFDWAGYRIASHVITVRKAGSPRPSPVPVSAKEAETVSVHFDMTSSAAGSVSVATVPVGATVFVDYADSSNGVSPVIVGNLTPGTHVILLKKAGYLQPRPVVALVQASLTNIITIPMITNIASARLIAESRSVPPGAAVYVDYLVTTNLTDSIVDWMDPAKYAGTGWSNESHTVMLRQNGSLPPAPRYVQDRTNVTQTMEIHLLGDPVTAVDADHNGLPDQWEDAYRLRELAPSQHGPNDDPDHDGFSNIQEMAAGTNPLDANSVLVVATMGLSALGQGQTVTFTFDTVPGRTYILQGADDLNGSWLNLSGLILATADHSSYSTQISEGKAHQFYRLIVLAP